MRFVVLPGRAAGPALVVAGSPALYKTKGAAVAAFEAWRDLALERWAEFKRTSPHAILTAVGVKELS